MVALSWGKGAGGVSAGPGAWASWPGLQCQDPVLFSVAPLAVSPLCCGPCPGPGSPGEQGAQLEVQEMPCPCLAWLRPQRLRLAPRLPDTGVVTAERTADQRGSTAGWEDGSWRTLVVFSPERGPGSQGPSQDRLRRGVAALPAAGSAGGPAHLEALAGCWRGAGTSAQEL